MPTQRVRKRNVVRESTALYDDMESVICSDIIRALAAAEDRYFMSGAT